MKTAGNPKKFACQRCGVASTSPVPDAGIYIEQNQDGQKSAYTLCAPCLELLLLFFLRGTNDTDATGSENKEQVTQMPASTEAPGTSRKRARSPAAEKVPSEVRSLGIPAPSSIEEPPTKKTRSCGGSEHTCYPCGRTFSTRAGLGLHLRLARVHASKTGERAETSATAKLGRSEIGEGNATEDEDPEEWYGFSGAPSFDLDTGDGARSQIERVGVEELDHWQESDEEGADDEDEAQHSEYNYAESASESDDDGMESVLDEEDMDMIKRARWVGTLRSTR
ncbi:hypothetical protein BV25DRAFT_1826834 [Artomyces pyxidatus]|uniref:Uncharacterized protein n=1 Tax=Artomyces pyxidatus TaxID=48021 RepID=A0ACB8SY29_9AGAM|nr:hypothetical protein BV25DRAFT_1826834 [Artomyces pyxidatus]